MPVTSTTVRAPNFLLALRDDDVDNNIRYNTTLFVSDLEINQVNPIEINQVEQEIEAKLKLLCSKEAIEAEVHLMWSLNSKQAKRVQIRTKDKEEAEK